MTWLAKTIFGKVEFPESEELREFQYKFLILLQVFAGITSALFVGLAHLDVFPRFHEIQMQVIFTHALLMAASWLTLRERQQLFLPIAWFTVLVTLADILSYFVLVDNDEVRVLWFLVFVPGVYLILGVISGAAITAVTIASILLINSYIARPLSANAVATTVMSLLFFAVFHHAYAKRSNYFFTRMQESNDRLRDMAMRDMLTSVLNAHTYYEICDRQILVANRQNAPYSVLFVDLDHFKDINDTYGHATGDSVLRAVAQCLSSTLRASDVLGRVGGEEFSIFLPNTDTKGATTLAESIRSDIETLKPSFGEHTLRITASIGVAGNEQTDQTMLEIQKRADRAMYSAKAAGRNCVSVLRHDA